MGVARRASPWESSRQVHVFWTRPEIGDFIIQMMGPTTHEVQLDRDDKQFAQEVWNVPWYQTHAKEALNPLLKQERLF